MRKRNGKLVCQVFGCKVVHNEVLKLDQRGIHPLESISSYKFPSISSDKKRYCTNCFGGHHADCSMNKIQRRKGLNCMCECPKCINKRRMILFSTWFGVVFYRNL